MKQRLLFSCRNPNRLSTAHIEEASHVLLESLSSAEARQGRRRLHPIPLPEFVRHREMLRPSAVLVQKFSGSGWAALFAEPVFTIACHGDFPRSMILLKEVEALPEIAPKREQFRLVRVTLCEPLESVFCQPRREYLDRNVTLARGTHLHRQPIDLLDPFVGYGNAADGHAIPMQENISAGIGVRSEDPVGGVRIADVQAQEKIALRVEPIQFVEAFGNLCIAELSFRPKQAGGRANPVDVHERQRSSGLIRSPEFEQRFFLKSAKKDGTRRIGYLFFLKHPPQSIVLLFRGGADAGISGLLVAERLDFF